MVTDQILQRYLTELLNGDRVASRAIIEETLRRGIPANNVYMDIIWPIMNEIDKLYKSERINSAQEAFATRINRTIVDQLQNKLPKKKQKSKKIVVCSSFTEQAELGAQIITDLFESDGWDARFLGGVIQQDDILEFIHTFNPDILLFYGINAKFAPAMRNFIDTVKNINACPDMRIMLSGGVFDRAQGLWEEIGADLYAQNAADAVKVASMKEPPIPQRTINRRKQAAATDHPNQNVLST